DSAHMAIAGRDIAAMRELDELAVPAMPAREPDDAVDRGGDRRAIGRADVDALVHAREAEDRVEAPAERGGDVPRDGHLHRAGVADLAVGVEPVLVPVLAPADELDLAALARQPGEQQLADLHLAGGGA